MTIASEIDKPVEYTGNGSTVAFPYGERVLDENHLVVSIVDDETGVATVTTEYTVSGVGLDAGVTITMDTAPASGETLQIDEDIPAIQETPYEEATKFPAQTVEDSLDYVTKLVSSTKSKQSRSVQLNDGETDIDDDKTKLPVYEANKLIGLDANKKLSFYDPTTGTPNDASAVTFTQSGTGATQTTVEAKLFESVSVKDFGAVEDSSGAATANVTAFNAAAAKAKTINATLIDAGGEYYIDSKVTLDGINVDFTGKLLIASGATPFTAVEILSTSNKSFKINVEPADLDWTSGGVCVHFKRGWYNKLEIRTKNWEVGFLCDNDAVSAGGSQENRLTLFGNNHFVDHKVVTEVSTDYWNNNTYTAGNFVCTALDGALQKDTPIHFKASHGQINENVFLTTNFESSKNSQLFYDTETGNFTAGLTVTGGTSSATATIDSVDDNGTDGSLFVSSVSGTFVDGETITDSSTGSAAMVGGLDTAHRSICKMEASVNRNISRNVFRDVRVEQGSSGLKHLVEYKGVGDILDNVFELSHVDATDWDIVKEAGQSDASQTIEIGSSGEFWQDFSIGRPIIWYSGGNQRINLETYNGSGQTFDENTNIVHDFDGNLASATSQISIGRRFVKSTAEPVFIEFSEVLEGLIVCFDGSGNRLTGTAPSYARGDRDVYNAAGEGYRIRSKWLWLDTDVAEVHIGQASWQSSTPFFTAYNFKVLWGTLKDKGITNPNPSSDAIPTAGIFQSGQLIGSQNGSDSGWVNSSAGRTALNGGEPTSETSMVVDSISGFTNGDIIGVQLDATTKGMKDIHWTTINGVPSGSTIVLTTGLPSAAADGNELISQKYTAF